MIKESVVYSILHDYLTIRDSKKPFFGYTILFDLLELDKAKVDHLRRVTEDYPVEDSVEKSADALLEIWLKIIENEKIPERKFLQS